MGEWTLQRSDDTVLEFSHNTIPGWCSLWAFFRLSVMVVGMGGAYLALVLHYAYGCIFLLSQLIVVDILFRRTTRGTDHILCSKKTGVLLLRRRRPWPGASESIIRPLRNLSCAFQQTDLRFARLGAYARKLRVCLDDGELITLTTDDSGTKGFVENEGGMYCDLLQEFCDLPGNDDERFHRVEVDDGVASRGRLDRESMTRAKLNRLLRMERRQQGGGGTTQRRRRAAEL